MPRYPLIGHRYVIKETKASDSKGSAAVSCSESNELYSDRENVDFFLKNYPFTKYGRAQAEVCLAVSAAIEYVARKVNQGNPQVTISVLEWRTATDVTFAFCTINRINIMKEWPRRYHGNMEDAMKNPLLTLDSIAQNIWLDEDKKGITIMLGLQ